MNTKIELRFVRQKKLVDKENGIVTTVKVLQYRELHRLIIGDQCSNVYASEWQTVPYVDDVVLEEGE